jgi:RsmE family RNA methyltransferase
MIFYVPNISSGEIKGDDTAHLLSMRVQSSNQIIITDLKGNYVDVELLEVDKKKKLITYRIVKTHFKDRKNNSVIIQAIPDRLYVEKMVEALGIHGVGKIYFFYSDRSAQQDIKIDRLQRILQRACELAEHKWAPEVIILEKGEINEILQQHQPIVLEQMNTSNSSENNSNHQAVLVGPEGGWSKSEIEKFHNLKLYFHSMGDVVYPAWLAGFAYLERCKFKK